jgi:small-conductance mechanosensitive channel
MVIQSVLFNYTDDEQRRSEVAFSVAYGSDLGLTREITVDAVSEIEMIHAHPAPVAYVDALGGDGIDMEMRFYHDDADRIAVRDAVAEAILVALEGAAIDLSTPEIIVQKADTHQ